MERLRALLCGSDAAPGAGAAHWAGESAVAVRGRAGRSGRVREVDVGGGAVPGRTSSCPATGCGRWSGRRGRHRREHGRVRAAGRGRAATARAPADDRDRHARARRRSAALGWLALAREQRPAVRRGRVRHPRRASAGSATGSGPSGSRPTCSTGAAADLGGDPRRAADRGVRRGAGAAAGPRRARGVRGGRAAARRQEERPDRAAVRPAPRRVQLRRRTAATAARLREIATAAEAAGLRRDLRDGPLPADPAGRPGLGRLPGELHDARLPGRVHPAGAASGRWSPASRTATSPTWARSSPPSTC